MFVLKKSVRRTACAAAVLALVAPSVLAGAADPQATQPVASSAAAGGIATDQLIVKYRDAQRLERAAQASPMAQARLSRVEAAAAQRGLRLEHLRNNALDAHVLKLDRRTSVAELQRLAAELRAQDPDIEYAEPDRVLQPLLTPNDGQYTNQWDLYDATGGIRAPQAWDLSTGSGVTVAVIDTGYRPHADLAANVVTGHDFISNTSVANDGGGRDTDARDAGDWVAANECGSNPASNSSWHGTHVAGTIAAVTNNGSGIAGVAFGAKVQPARVLGKCGGYTSDIADAIVWTSGGSVSGVPANATPSRVLNLSLGGPGACDNTTQNAIHSARSRQAVVVVAAGNDNADAGGFSPASCSGIVTVAATTRTGARAYYSNYGTKVTLAAPGGDVRSSAANGILSTLNAGTTTATTDNYAYYQGTSMAAPHVAGVAALMISRKPTATADEVINALKSSARPFPASCSGCGVGLLDAHAAVQAITGTVSPPTGATETEPNNSMSAANFRSAPVTLNASMASSTDQDWFSLDLPAGRTLTVTMTPNSTSDYDVYVYNSNGSLLGKSENGTGAVDRVSTTNTGTSTFRRYVKVVYYSGGTGSTSGKYTVGLSW